MIDAYTVTVVCAVFLLAGTVKGVIGLGLPSVSLALLAVTLDLTSAMALLLIPSFATNLWQAVVGGHLTAAVKRLWPFLLAATVTVWLGALALPRVDLSILTLLLGILLALYAGLSLAGLAVRISSVREGWLGPLTGAVNGVLTGMTGSFVVPGVIYLAALGMPREMFIQAMGLLFTLSTVALAVALGGHGLLTLQLGALSAAGLAPAILGMVLGTLLRRRLGEAQFRRLFFVALLILGFYIITSAGRALA